MRAVQTMRLAGVALSSSVSDDLWVTATLLVDNNVRGSVYLNNNSAALFSDTCEVKRGQDFEVKLAFLKDITFQEGGTLSVWLFEAAREADADLLFRNTLADLALRREPVPLAQAVVRRGHHER